MRGDERKAVQEELKKGIRPGTILENLIQNTDPEIVADGHNQDLRKIDVLYQANSELKRKERLSLKSMDIADIVESWIQDQKTQDPFIRHVGFPLTAILFSQEEFDLIKDKKNLILHMDATGSVVQTPNGLKSKISFIILYL